MKDQFGVLEDRIVYLKPIDKADLPEKFSSKPVILSNFGQCITPKVSNWHWLGIWRKPTIWRASFVTPR
jgi:hypothetical protein